MNRDGMLYKWVYTKLKNKIEMGALPIGGKLPSRAELCKEFGVSHKPVRRALEMLVQDGLIETAQRKRPTVIRAQALPDIHLRRQRQSLDQAISHDLLQSGILLCSPVNRRGLLLCHGDDWAIPQAILAQMDPSRPQEFWRLSNRFWGFFIARPGNEFILRAVKSLGLSDVAPLPGSQPLRAKYLRGLRDLVDTLRQGGAPEQVRFDDLSSLYGFLMAGEEGTLSFLHKSPEAWRCGEQWQRLFHNGERPKSICLDLLGHIAMGYYRPGDRLPSHERLGERYLVSTDTSVKAVETLRQWGVVTTKRGHGTFVAMDLEQLKEIELPLPWIAAPLRRFLDSLELLALTVEGVALNIGSHVSMADIQQLRWRISPLGDAACQFVPGVLLEFLVDHIPYKALQAVYRAIMNNYHIGRSIPALISPLKTAGNSAIAQQCQNAVRLLDEGTIDEFAAQTARAYGDIQRMARDKLRQSGYLEAAMQAYDGARLWQP